MKMKNKASAKYMFFHPFSLENVFLFNFFFICKCVNKIFLALHILSFYFCVFSSIFNFNIYFIQHLLMTGSLFQNRENIFCLWKCIFFLNIHSICSCIMRWLLIRCWYFALYYAAYRYTNRSIKSLL